jgi:hypothetical protein
MRSLFFEIKSSLKVSVAALITALALSGCAHSLHEPDSPALTRDDQLLTESAAESAAANRAVAEIESEAAARAAPAPYSVLPGQSISCPLQKGVGCASHGPGVTTSGPGAIVMRDGKAASVLPGTGDVYSGAPLPEGMTRLVSMDWDGPIEPAVRTLAKKAGWTFAVKGHRPATPVTVTLHRREQPLWTLVRDAGILVTDRATVVIDVTSRQIEVRYAQ